MARCKRTTSVRSYLIPAAGAVDVPLAIDTTEYTLRVVDATTAAGVAFTFAYGDSPGSVFDFAAGESWQEEHIGPLAHILTLRLGAAVAARAELVIWEQ